MNKFAQSTKNRVLVYMAAGVLFLALLTPLFLQSQAKGKLLESQSEKTSVLVEEVEISSKEDSQSLGKRPSPHGRRGGYRVARGYGWSD